MSIPRFSPSLFDFAAERFGEAYAGSPSVSLGSFIRDGVVLATNSYSGLPMTTSNFGVGVRMADFVGLTSVRVWTSQANHLYTANNGNKVMTLNSRWYAHCFNGGSSLGSFTASSTPEKFINNVWSTSAGPITGRTFAMSGGIYNDSITTCGRTTSSSITSTETYNGTSWTTRTSHPYGAIAGCGAGSATDFIAGSGNASTQVSTYSGQLFYTWNGSAWTQVANSTGSQTNSYAGGWGKPNFGNSGFHHNQQIGTSVYRYQSDTNTWTSVGAMIYQNGGSNQTQADAGGGGLAGINVTQTNGSNNSGFFTRYTGWLLASGQGSLQLSQPSLPKNGGTIGTPYNNNWFALLSHGGIYSFGWINYTSTQLLQVTSTTTNQTWL